MLGQLILFGLVLLIAFVCLAMSVVWWPALFPIGGLFVCQWKCRQGFNSRSWRFLLLMLSLMRIGEASNPGPNVQFEDFFTLGTCNPSGLRNKSHYFASQLSKGDIWMISETHFFGKDVSRFRAGLRAAGGRYRYCVTDEASTRPCLQSQTAWKGVAAISCFPTRILPSAQPECLKESGRCLLTTTLVHDSWISGATIYGEPDGHLYPNHLRNNEFLLHHAAAQICHLTAGLRFLAGDWNVVQNALPSFDILLRAGFRGIQDVLLERWGHTIMPTCKHATRKDFLYLSPEMQELLIDVWVLDDVLPDHAALLGQFKSPRCRPSCWVWPRPHAFPWPKTFDADFQWNDVVSPTEAYQQLWNEIESQAIKGSPFPISRKMCGRAKHLEPKLLKPAHVSPLKVGRKGDFQPGFCGQSTRHAHWLRQVRRLQAYCRLMNSSSDVAIQTAESWGAILRAKGFFPTFSDWWLQCEQRVHGAPAQCPCAPPGGQTALAMFDSMVLALRAFESCLMKQSRQYAKFRREQNPNLVFQDIKPPVTPGVEILLQPICAEVEEVDADECKLVLNQPCEFAPDQVIVCGDRALDVIHHEGDALWVTDTSHASVGMQVSQTKPVGTSQELETMFLQVWRERWMRHAEVPSSRWNEIVRFAKTHLPPGRFDWSPLNADSLAEVIRHKKASTSMGFDGVSLQDLRCMPHQALTAFCHIFSTAEATGTWPQQLVDGKVVSLAKVPRPSGPSDFRPITVFSLLYRCWSSVQSKIALSHLEEKLPDTLYGSRPGRHATQIWSRLLWTIEEAFGLQIPVAGAVADLAKAFNFLPRLVVMEVAAHFGLPSRVLLAWTGALTQMQRRFQLRDSLSAGLGSTTGVPEGCGLSCVAMVVIDACFHKWMQVFFPLCTPVSFVDDWQLITCNPTLLQGAVSTMHRFADAMDLHLDERKAYVWTIDQDGRKLLRQQGFKVLLGAKNLGAHVQLAKKHTNFAMQERVDSMQAVWPRLKLSACSIRTKVRALTTAAWPKALHAIAAVQLADASFHKLRTGAVRGLGCDQAVSNAWIQLGMIESPFVDPQCWAILQTFRCVRDCGENDHVRRSLALLVTGTEAPPANSFTTTLLTRLQTLGWHVLPTGQICDSFGPFCLFEVCLSELKCRIQWAWQRVVAQQVSHRPGFANLCQADARDTRTWLKTLPYDSQELFKKCLSGCHITQDCKQHCQEGGSDQCPYCLCTDSRFHRFWVCERFASERSSVPEDVLKLIATAPEFLTCYGWSVQPHTMHRWLQMLQAIPETPPVLLQGVGDDIHLFTDGSCLNQHARDCRMASWAVVGARTDVCAGEVLDYGPLPGILQSAYRAEVYAVLRALMMCRSHKARVFLWTDCNAVVVRLRRLLKGGSTRPNCAHADLWIAIEECLQDCAGEVRVTKVAAHQSSNQVTGPLEEWAAHHNHLADRAAVAAQHQRPQIFLHFYAEHVNATCACQELSRTVQKVLLAISKAVVRDQDHSEDVERAELCVSPPIPGSAVAPLPPFHVPQAAVRWYGDKMVRLVLSWYWQTLHGSAHPVIWVSKFQLYIDFMLSGECGPLKIHQWQLGVSRPEIDLLNIPFQTRTRWFSKVLTVSLRHHGVGFHYAYCRPESQCFQLHTGCLAVAWPPARIAAIDEWVFSFCPYGVTRTSKALNSLPCADADSRFDRVLVSSY